MYPDVPVSIDRSPKDPHECFQFHYLDLRSLWRWPELDRNDLISPGEYSSVLMCDQVVFTMGGQGLKRLVQLIGRFNAYKYYVAMQIVLLLFVFYLISLSEVTTVYKKPLPQRGWLFGSINVREWCHLSQRWQGLKTRPHQRNTPEYLIELSVFELHCGWGVLFF